MAQVTYTNLFSEPRNNVKALINDSSNVSDPLISSAEFRKWIYSRFPDVKANGFSGYPFIVLKSTDLEIPEEEGSADGRSRFVNWEIDIEIYTSDRSEGGQSGKGLSHMESISDDIVQTLMNITNRKTLKSLGMSSEAINPSEISEQPLKNELTYKRIIPLSFNNRLKVSA